MDATKRPQSFVGDNAESKLLILTDRPHAKFLVSYGGDDAAHGTEEVAGETFVGVKGYKAKGKRLTTLAVEKVEEVETPYDDTPESPQTETIPAEDGNATEDHANLDPDLGKSQQQVIDEITGQLNLFDDEEK